MQLTTLAKTLENESKRKAFLGSTKSIACISSPSLVAAWKYTTYMNYKLSHTIIDKNRILIALQSIKSEQFHKKLHLESNFFTQIKNLSDLILGKRSTF
jgi:hypothetical protein